MARVSGYKRIKKELLKGGLVITRRRAGKTRALLEILYEDPTAHLITHGRYIREAMIEEYEKTYGLMVSDRILDASQHRVGDILPQDNVYIDEYFLILPHLGESNIRERFKAATTTAPFPVRIVKPTKSELKQLEPWAWEQFNWLGARDFEAENLATYTEVLGVNTNGNN